MTPGRKRAFDKTEALDKAMRVFWDNGYSGTSIADLTEALGINKPSLYAAFGNKEQLFRAALDRYMSQYGAPLMERLTTPEDAPLGDRLRSYLIGVGELVTDETTPSGCFFVKSNCESGGDAFPAEVSASLRQLGLAREQALTRFLRHEQRHGHLSETANPRALAHYLISVMYGLSVLARSGTSGRDIEAVIELALTPIAADKASASHSGRRSKSSR